MALLDLTFYCAAATALMALPFFVVNFLRYMSLVSRETYMKTRFPSRVSVARASAKFPIKSVIFFVLPILISSVVAEFMTTSARAEVLKFIKGLSGHYTVSVNQDRAADAGEVVSALKGIASYWAHHSRPTRRIRVEIRSSQGDLTLELGRDSGNPQEYWVFMPEHGVTSNNEIGRITTPVFDKY